MRFQLFQQNSIVIVGLFAVMALFNSPLGAKGGEHSHSHSHAAGAHHHAEHTGAHANGEHHHAHADANHRRDLNNVNGGAVDGGGAVIEGTNPVYVLPTTPVVTPTGTMSH